MNKAFNPLGMPVLLTAGVGHSLNGEIRPGQDGGATAAHDNDQNLGPFDTEWGEGLNVFYCPDTDDCYVLIDGDIWPVDSSSDAPWYDLLP